MSVDLSVSIAGIPLQNPVIAASGTFGYGTEYSQVMDVSVLGGILFKGTYSRGKAGKYRPAHFRNA